jgi:hypothetical protein
VLGWCGPAGAALLAGSSQFIPASTMGLAMTGSRPAHGAWLTAIAGAAIFARLPPHQRPALQPTRLVRALTAAGITGSSHCLLVIRRRPRSESSPCNVIRSCHDHHFRARHPGRALAVGVAGVPGDGGSAHAVSHFSVLGYHLTGSAGTLFLSGIVVGAGGLLGLSLVLAGARRTSRGSAARRGLQQSRRETAAASQERDDLISQRDTARAYTDSNPGNGTGPRDTPLRPAGDRWSGAGSATSVTASPPHRPPNSQMRSPGRRPRFPHARPAPAWLPAPLPLM